MNVKEITEFILNEREKQKISRLKLARMAGCTNKSIDNWQSGRRKMTIDSAESLLNALGYELTITEKEDE